MCAHMNETIQLYTNGACKGNPGPGGYGAVLLCGGDRKEISGGYRKTNISRMELKSCIAGLSPLTSPSVVTLTSSSQYVVNAMARGMAKRWAAKGWNLSPSKPVKNADLWKQLLTMCEKHTVVFHLVQAIDVDVENVRCEVLAEEASEMEALPADTIFEAPKSTEG